MTENSLLMSQLVETDTDCVIIDETRFLELLTPIVTSNPDGSLKNLFYIQRSAT